MASYKSKIKRGAPLLLALVVLISCLPVIPVSATLGSGEYTLTFDLDGGEWSDGSSGGTVTGDPDDWLCPNVPVRSGYIFAGWALSGAGEYDADSNEFCFGEGDSTLTALWTSNELLVYKTTLTIGDQTYVFTRSNARPEVNLSVSSTGATLTSDMASETYTYTYSGDGTFQGLTRDASGATIDFPVGSSTTIDGGSNIVLYPISTTYDPYTSVVTIGSEQFSFSSPTEQPAATVSVTDTGARLYYGSMSYTYTYSGEGTFQGLSYSETGAASLVPGESYQLAAGDHTLYAIASTAGDTEGFYSTTVVIDGGKFVFAGTADASPTVSMTVTETGAALYCGALIYHYPYTGSGVYLGLTLAGSSEIAFPIGTTATFSGADGADVLYTLVPCVASQTYTKVTQNLADWTGTYLIVYDVSDTEGYVFTGVDEKLTSVLTQIVDGSIVTSASDLAFCPVRIEPYGSGYSIKLLSGVNVGKYIYASPSGYNDILFSDEPQQLTISHDGTNAYILDGEVPFQFNKTSSYLWFRFFGAKPGGQSEISLYKLDDGSSGGEFVLSAGQWEANKSLVSVANKYVALSDWPDGLNPVALSFISNGQSYSSISYRNTIEFGYSLFFDNTRVYGYDTIAAIVDPGWQSDAYPLIYFAEDQCVSEAFYTWFTSNFSYVGSDLVEPVYKTTVNIYDSSGLVLYKSFVFSGRVAPVATLTVLDDGLSISCQEQVYSLRPLSGAFYGFSYMKDGSAVYEPGQSYTLPGGASSDVVINLYQAVQSSDGFATIIVIDGQAFQFTDEDVYPCVVVSPYSSCVYMGVEGGSISRWYPSPSAGQYFLGFSLYPGSDEVFYPVFSEELTPGYSVQGSSSGNVLILYPVYSFVPPSGSGSSGGSDVSGDVVDDPAGVGNVLSGFVDFLIVPVSAFFNVEFIPGFSFGKLALVAFVFGLMFWLLKVTS